jgi:hypothetical protein
MRLRQVAIRVRKNDSFVYPQGVGRRDGAGLNWTPTRVSPGCGTRYMRDALRCITPTPYARNGMLCANRNTSSGS